MSSSRLVLVALAACVGTLLADDSRQCSARREERERRARLCIDAGPFACVEAECPAAMLSCADLAQLFVGGDGLCTLQFSVVWDRSPPAGTEGYLVSDLCPRACGTCTRAGWALQSGCDSEAAAPAAAVDDEGRAEVALADWLRQTGPAALEAGLCRHTDEQAFVSRSPFGGRGVFARRDLVPGETIHVVRSSHLIGDGWAPDDGVLSAKAIRQLLAVLRGVQEGARFRAYAELLPAFDDLYALPELWGEEELGWLQDGQIVRLAKATAPTLTAWHAALERDAVWDPPLTLDEVRWARALLQSRPLGLSSGSATAQRQFFLVPFVDSANTWLVPGEQINVKLSSLRTAGVDGADEEGAAHRPRAILVATRAIAAGEELFLDYGLDLRETPARLALLNYGILGNGGTEHFHADSLRRTSDGSLICQPLWCVENGPTYAGMTASRHAAAFPERIRKLQRDLDSAPWNATTVDGDVDALLAARSALHSLDQRGQEAVVATHANWFKHDPRLLSARRRVVALEYRLGCKLGVLSAIAEMSSHLEQRHIGIGS